MARILVLWLLLGTTCAWAQGEVGPPPPEAQRVQLELSRLERARLSNGRVDWRRVHVASEGFGAGAGTYLLAVFLKELSTGLAEGDPGRVQELFSEMGALGLFHDYGLFVAGAAGSTMAYDRFLQRHVAARSATLSRAVRSNLALATGLALPRLVRGEGLDRAYVISFASLGLSAVAVESAMTLIPGTQRLRAAGAMAHAGRALRLGGWIYRGAELALVLTVGEVLGDELNDLFQRRDLRRALADAAERLLEVEDAELPAALDDYAARWDDWRTYLLKPAVEAQADFGERMARLARQAKLDDQKAARARQLVERFDGLPLAEFADAVGGDPAIAGRFAEVGDRYERALDGALAEAYREHVRDDPFLARDAERRDVVRAHRAASRNRLQTYADQREALAAVARLRGTHTSLSALGEQLGAMELLDQRLLSSGGLRVEAQLEARGVTELLEGALGGARRFGLGE